MICGGLVFIGLILHLCTGGLDWSSFAWPLNVYLAIVYVAVLVILYLVRRKVYFVRWAMSYQAAIPSLIFVVFLTFIMGITKQVPASVPREDVPLFGRMLSFWPFVLVYFWMTTIVGLVSVRYLFSFKLSKIPFFVQSPGTVCSVGGRNAGKCRHAAPHHEYTGGAGGVACARCRRKSA